MANIRREFGDDLTLKNGNLGINTITAQERVDVVGVVKGRDLNVTGVSSLTAYEGFLRADNQIVEETNLEFGNGLKSSLSGEIIVGTGVTVTIGAVGLGTAEVGVGNTTGANGKTASNIDTTDINLAGGSQIECLKVYNTFTPPSGGTNERPYAPKPGELYYNYDFKTIEFFDGNGWRQVDNTTRSGRGLFGGGESPVVANIDLINIQSQGNATNFGDLSVARRIMGGFSSNTRGLWGGGSTPSNSDVIDYVTIASEGNAIDFGNITTATDQTAACSSSTRGLVGGGESPSTTNVISYVEISTTGNSLDFGDLSEPKRGHSGMASATRGFFCGGNTPGSTTVIDFVTIASKGNAVKFGDRIEDLGGTVSASNSIKGLIFDSNIISFITLASEGNAVYFGSLTTGSGRGSALASQTRVVTAIGTDGVTDPVNNIEYVTIATSGNAVDFGDLTVARKSSGACSDSHGGLGGF